MTWDELPDHARVWVYTANRQLTDAEGAEVERRLSAFTQRWTAHARALKAFAELRHGRFVLLAVDESQAGASGCSIDASVHFLQQLGRELDVDFFERLTFFADAGEGFLPYSREEFELAYAEGRITPATPVVDPLVDTKATFDVGFVKPLVESWHARLV